MLALDDLTSPHHATLAQVQHLLGAHRRHLAGHPRAIADGLQLYEIIERLQALAARADDVPALRDAIAERLVLLRAELHDCVHARMQPLPPSKAFDCLGVRANQQFALYRRMFAGRSRLSRRPALAQRVFVNLSMIQWELRALDATQLPDAGAHARAVELIDKQIEQLREEGRQIVSARSRAPREQLIRQLGADASLEIAGYRKLVGDAPASADVDALGAICDRLGELMFQMATLADQTDDSINAANLRHTARTLVAYELAHARLADARPIW